MNYSVLHPLVKNIKNDIWCFNIFLTVYVYFYDAQNSFIENTKYIFQNIRLKIFFLNCENQRS